MISKKLILLIASFLILPIITLASYGDTDTYVGQIIAGDGEKATDAYFDFPEDMCSDGNGNFYLADTYNHVIRKINSDEYVDTLAGTGSYGDTIGNASSAEFANPKGVGCDSNGTVIVADTGNDKIKKISNGKVTTLAENLNEPEGVHLNGNNVYFVDTGNNALKKVSINGGSVSTITNKLNDPKKLDIYGDYAYIADSGSYKLLKVNLSNGAIETVAGNGTEGNRTSTCSRTMFRNLWGVVVRNENEIFISDGTGNIVDNSETGRGTGFLVKISIINGECNSEVFADDENMVSLNFPNGMDIYQNYVYVASTGIGIIYRYNLDDANDNSKFAGKSRFGEDYGKDAIIGRPKNLLLNAKNKKEIFFIENNKLSKFNTQTKQATFIAGNVVDNYPDNDDEWFIGDKARFSDPRGMALAKKGKYLYVADRNNNRIRMVNLTDNSVGYLTGAGKTNVIGGADDNDYQEGKACANEFELDNSNCAYFNRPTGLVIDTNKNVLYVSDTDNQVIRKIYLKGAKKGKTKLVAGSAGQAGLVDGVKSKAKFSTPFSLAINNKGTVLYVADRDNNAIRKIRLSDGKVTTLAGTGKAGYQDGVFSSAQFSYPLSLAYKDRKLYVTEVGSQRIRLLDLALGVVKLVAGSGERGYRDSNRDNSKFNDPSGIAVKKNYLFVADELNDTIRRVNIMGTAPYTDPAPTISYCTPKSLKYSDYPSGSAMIEIKGTNFRYGTKAYFGSYAVTTYVQSSTSLAVSVPIGSMAYGYYEVKIVNNDGQYDKLQRAFSAQEYSGNVPNKDYWTN